MGGTVESLAVLETSTTHGQRLVATLRVIAYLRGSAQAQRLALPLHVGGIRGFDTLVSPGDHGVSFLRSIDGDVARLQTWSAFAVYPSGYFQVD